jgi:hypothetical protein
MQSAELESPQGANPGQVYVGPGQECVDPGQECVGRGQVCGGRDQVRDGRGGASIRVSGCGGLG